MYRVLTDNWLFQDVGNLLARGSDDDRKFIDQNYVQGLGSAGFYRVCKITVSTIQHLYAQRNGRGRRLTVYLRGYQTALRSIDKQHQIVAAVEAKLDRQITRSNRLRESTFAAAFCHKL